VRKQAETVFEIAIFVGGFFIPQFRVVAILTLPRDAITHSQDFLISAHPHCENLYLAVGGSFHGWKFLPTLGKYVVHMLEGRLAPELANRWAWDSQNPQPANERMIPSRELVGLKLNTSEG